MLKKVFAMIKNKVRNSSRTHYVHIMVMKCLWNNQEQIWEPFKNTLCSRKVFEINKKKYKHSSRKHFVQKSRRNSQEQIQEHTVFMKSLWNNQEHI